MSRWRHRRKCVVNVCLHALTLDMHMSLESTRSKYRRLSVVHHFHANNTVTSWYGRPRVPLLSSDKLQCLGTLWCQITDVTRTLQCSNNSIGPTGNVPLDGGNVPEALSVRLHLAALGKRPADVTVARQWQHVNHTEENKVRPLDLKTTTDRQNDTTQIIMTQWLSTDDRVRDRQLAICVSFARFNN